MKQIKKYAATFTMLALFFHGQRFARERNQQSVDHFGLRTSGYAQLKPGNYTVQWQGTAPRYSLIFTRWKNCRHGARNIGRRMTPKWFQDEM